MSRRFGGLPDPESRRYLRLSYLSVAVGIRGWRCAASNRANQAGSDVPTPRARLSNHAAPLRSFLFSTSLSCARQKSNHKKALVERGK